MHATFAKTLSPLLAMIVTFVTLVALLAGPGAANTSLSLSESSSSKTLPLARAQWPRPSDKNQVFYIQRSMNRNTVVYAARFDSAGALASPPIHAYWRRYGEQGQTKPLKTMERLIAYGVKSRRSDTPDIYKVTFAALSDLKAELRQSGPFQAALWASINGRDYKLVYGFLDLDTSGLITRVARLRLYTYDPVSENYVTHIISVSGGDISE